MIIEECVPLAPFTTFCIGGPARFFLRARNINDITEALAFARARALPVLILGGGSNVLIDDDGFEGVALKIECMGVSVEGTTLIAGAGESWDALCAFAVSRGLWGVENLSGIPGSVGGAVLQNIGAYGAAVSQTLAWVEAYDCSSEGVRTFTRDELAFGYRSSLLQKERGRYIVMRAAFSLSVVPAPNLTYLDLARLFEGRHPSLREIRQGVLLIRARKFPDLSLEGTAGSFFKNPTLPEAQALALKARYPDMPLFLLPESPQVKVPIAWFLDYRHGVLDMRALAHGGARVFERHALVIAASRGTAARDVRALARDIATRVHDATGITLESEVHCVSFSGTIFA